MSGEVVHLFICPVPGLPMKQVEDVRAIEDTGLDGCAHGQGGSPRQVLLMDAETLAELKLPPGALKENIVSRNISLKGLRSGQQLRVGEALLEVAILCEPCKQMDDIWDGLQEALQGRRGMLCRVLQSGMIRRGDAIQVLESTEEVSG